MRLKCLLPNKAPPSSLGYDPASGGEQAILRQQVSRLRAYGDYGAGGLVRSVGLAKNTGYYTSRQLRVGPVKQQQPAAAAAVDHDGEQQHYASHNQWAGRIPRGQDMGWTQRSAYESLVPQVAKHHPLFRAVEEEANKKAFLMSLKQEGPVKQAARRNSVAWFSERNQHLVDRMSREQVAVDCEVRDVRKALDERGEAAGSLDVEALNKMRMKAKEALQARAAAAQAVGAKSRRLSMSASSAMDKNVV